MLLWHTPAHATVGNFKGELTGIEKRRFTPFFCDMCCAGISVQSTDLTGQHFMPVTTIFYCCLILLCIIIISVGGK